jgi:hypothetical protein
MMTCDGKTMFLTENHDGMFETQNHDVGENWLAMTRTTRTAHNDVINKLDRIGRLSNHDGKTLTISLWHWGDDPMDDAFAWIAMTVATKKAWEKAWERMHPDGVWARWGA